MDKIIGEWNIHLSYRYNGFGFMILLIGNWFSIQLGPVKLIISRKLFIETIKQVR